MLLEDDIGVAAEPAEVAMQIERSVAQLPNDAHVLYLEAYARTFPAAFLGSFGNLDILL